MGVVTNFYCSTSAYAGQGGFAYNAGHSTWIGCPIASFFGLTTYKGLGGVYSHPGEGRVCICVCKACLVGPGCA